MINISEIQFDNSEIREIINVLKSGQVVQGDKVTEFEKKFSRFIGVKHATAVNSGTSALYLSLLSLGIGKGDEVITTPFSFIASSNSILYTGAKPVFVDIRADTFNLDPKKIEEKINKRTKAILPVHLFGLSCDMDLIKGIAMKNNLFVIEDACQSHGATYKNKMTGAIGDIGCFSFYATKNMTTIEGGMIVTNKKNIEEKVRLLRNHGSKIRYHHDVLGYNFRMTELNASLGISQLKKLKSNNSKRINNAKYLISKLSNNKDFTIPSLSYNDRNHVFHQFTLVAESRSVRKILQAKLKQSGIRSTIYYPIPIHKQRVYAKLKYKDSLPIAEDISNRIFSIPVHQFLSKEELDKIVTVLS